MEIYLGIALGAFLKVWPVISNLKLLNPMTISKNKIIILLIYITFILFSTSTSFATVSLVISALLGKELYFLDNSMFNLLLSIFLYAIPFPIERLLVKNITSRSQEIVDNVNFEINTNLEQMNLARNIIKNYGCYIDKY